MTEVKHSDTAGMWSCFCECLQPLIARCDHLRQEECRIKIDIMELHIRSFQTSVGLKLCNSSRFYRDSIWIQHTECVIWKHSNNVCVLKLKFQCFIDTLYAYQIFEIFTTVNIILIHSKQNASCDSSHSLMVTKKRILSRSLPHSALIV